MIAETKNSTTERATTWGPRLLVALLLGLAVLDLVYGVYAIRQLREKRESDLIARIQLGQAQLIGDLLAVVEEAKQHSLYLSRHPDLKRRIVAGARGTTLAETQLESELLPYLVSFPKIDGLRVLDAEAKVLVIAARQGQGVALLPRQRLDAQPVLGDDKFGGPLAESGVQISTIEADLSRVEVPLEDRKYIYLRTAVIGSERQVIGSVILTVYAAPLIQALRRFQPIEGSRSCLWNRAGERLDSETESLALGVELDGALRQVNHHDSGDLAIFDRSPELAGLIVGTEVPAAVLRAEKSSLNPEFWIILITMLTVVVLLAVVAVFFYRGLVRDHRLRAAEQFLERIRLESAKYKSILEGAADMILMVAPESAQIIEVNHHAMKELGLTKSETQLDAIVHPEQVQEFQDQLRLAAATPGRVQGLSQLRLKTATGRDLTTDARFVAIAIPDGNLVQVSLRDRSEQIEIERRMRVADRLGSLGLLTAGVAHEINNPLAAIGNYLSLLKKPEVSTEQRLKYAELVHHGFQRIGSIVRDLLRFARPSSADGTADLSQVVGRSLDLVEFSEHRDQLQIKAQGFAAPILVKGDPGGLEQVLLNLLLNAARAVGETGEIVIRSQPADDLKHVDLIVEDTGPGIPPQDLDRIFDPFFTTSGGTGLGLSVSYGTMQAMGGALLVENRSGGGARFTLRCQLPNDQRPRSSE